MRCRLPFYAAAALAVFNAAPAYAWDEFGHVMVARIAWDHMTPQARTRSVELLRGAPAGSGLLRGVSPGSTSPQEQMWRFVSASHWPDDIKSAGHPGNGYHRGSRHFVNLFWEQRSDFGPVLPSSRPPFGELLADVPGLRAALTGSNAGEAALALAWIIHLAGDIHQPLHSSSRITPIDANGDRGGNDYRLSGSPGTLHGFWDGVITRNHRQRAGESEAGYLARVATDIAGRHPRGGLAAELAVTDWAAWAREGLALAQTRVYRTPLARNGRPPRSYEASALAAAELRIALAGYRLADLLDATLGRG